MASPNYGFSRGYIAYSGPDGNREADTFTCGHCNFVSVVKPMCDPADVGGLCKQCMRLICAGCVTRMVCDPIEKAIERSENRGIALRSYGL